MLKSCYLFGHNSDIEGVVLSMPCLALRCPKIIIISFDPTRSVEQTKEGRTGRKKEKTDGGFEVCSGCYSYKGIKIPNKSNQLVDSTFVLCRQYLRYCGHTDAYVRLLIIIFNISQF